MRDAANRRRIVEEGFLPGLKMTWALEAPVHIVLGMHVSFLTHRVGASVSGVDYPWVDVGIAGEHLVLAAAAAGLGTCWIGWIRPRVLAEIVGWPDSVRAVAVITIGYPSSPPEPAALPRNRRKPLDEIVRWVDAPGPGTP